MSVIRLVSLLIVAWLFSACATPQNPSSPRITRLSADETTRLTVSRPALALDDLLSMARSGATAEAIIARFRQSGARFDLAPAQVVDAHARGLPMPVLQAIHDDREKALRNELAQQLVSRDQQCAVEVSRERQRAVICPSPYVASYPGAWGAYPYRRSGVLWRW